MLVLSLLDTLVPSVVDEGFALVPHHTVFTPVPSLPIPFIWNLATAHFFESNIIKAVLIVPFIVVLTRLLERLWTVQAIALHVAFTVTCSGVMFVLAEVIHIYRTQHHVDFFLPTRGCSGLVVALAIGVRHSYPLEALPFFPRSWGLQCQHVPFAFSAGCVIVSCVFPVMAPELSFASFAFFFGWLHLRYMMWFPHTNVHGDHSPDFTFASMFPRLLRPVVTCIGTPVHNLSAACCPGFVHLRQADPDAGQGIVCDPTAAAFSDQNVSWGPSSSDAGSKEYKARRAKALALLDQNINSLLAPSSDDRPASFARRDVELGEVPNLASLGGGGGASLPGLDGIPDPPKQDRNAASPSKDLDL